MQANTSTTNASDKLTEGHNGNFNIQLTMEWFTLLKTHTHLPF